MTFGKTHASHASSSVDTAAFKLECRHSTLSEDTAEFVHPDTVTGCDMKPVLRLLSRVWRTITA